MKKTLSFILVICMFFTMFSFPSTVTASETESHKLMHLNAYAPCPKLNNEAIGGIIEDYAPDLIAFNEVNNNPAAIGYHTMLTVASLGYSYYGLSDWAPGSTQDVVSIAAWTNFVCYKTSKYNALAQGTFSISDNPTNPHAFISTMDQDTINNVEGRPRNCNWVLLESKATQDRFILASAHVQRNDYNATGIDILGAQLKALKTKYNCEVVCGGDMNTDGAGMAPAIAYGFNIANQNTATYVSGTQLDNVLYSSGFTASNYRVATEYHTEKKFPSDHYPQFVTMTKEVDTTARDQIGDIIFDNQAAVDWVNASGVVDATASLSSTGDSYMKITSADSEDPQVNLNISSRGVISADDYKYMVVTARTSKSSLAKMFLCPGTITVPTEDCTVTWNWTADGSWRDYVIDLSAITNWTGNINSIRFDYFNGNSARNSTLDLRSIKFYKTKPTTATVTTSKTSYTTDESITLNYSGLDSYLGTLQNQTPFVAIYPSDSYPGNTSALMYAYVNAKSGTLTFPNDAAGGTSASGLAEGSYKAWLAYDADGTKGSNNLNNVLYAGSKASYSFTITDAVVAPTTYSVTTNIAAGSGTVKLSNGSTSGNYEAGTTVSYTVTPASGYKVSKIIIYGTSQAILNNGAAATYSFPMEAVAATISVTFEAINIDTSVIDKIGTSTASGSNSAVIKIGTSVSDTVTALQTQLGTSVTITKDGAEVSSSTAIGTGMVVTAGSVTYAVVVAGDVDGDGAITVADASSAMAGLRGTATLSNASKDAVKELSGKAGSLTILDIMALLNSI